MWKICLKRTKIIETPETLSPRYSLRRRKTISKRYRHTSGQQPSLNVNIYHANRVERFVSPLQHQWLSLKRQTGINSKYKNLEYTDQLPKNLINSQSKTISCHLKKHVTNQRSRKCSEEERSWEKQCSFVEVAASKSMDHCSEKVETENIKDQKQSKLCPSLSRQQIQIHPKETSVKSAFVNTHKSDETSRVFPFQATSSGNLKIIPNQVVFESKKFSILVADPRHTKVNVKAEFNQSGANVGTSDSSNQTRYIDFPPGITPSTIDQLQLQAQKKLPYVEGNYKSRTRPNTKFYSEMEHNHSVQSTSHQLPPINEVPLASLGFTSEQPINWNNIILPEKTDLYQELTRRITNYKQIPNQTTTIAHAGSRLGNIINTMQSRIAEASQSGDKNVDIEKCQTPMDVDLVKGIWKRLSEEIMEQIDTSTSKLSKSSKSNLSIKNNVKTLNNKIPASFSNYNIQTKTSDLSKKASTVIIIIIVPSRLVDSIHTNIQKKITLSTQYMYTILIILRLRLPTRFTLALSSSVSLPMIS
ncbi:uncharacterized protein LOC105197110 isoform X3 [Solenopsis invicta]|uniref:uncharacterized protein LOC105197110 isoform X3 n=1 Tax=Solenopsis invicta TaxID=13686 RepID=UPI00193E3DEE|nr:uncharacterized protein LOC105197110 isoform X3 [Solenopsis invicta]